ncbi:MAG: tyrosine-type recombinase/integrase [Solirubrobacteraceae bacterium]
MSSPITISGHTHLRPGKRGGVWYAKWRDATGQHEKRLGKDWSASGRPAPGFLREKDAQAALDAILVDARRGAAAQGRTGVTFKDHAEEWYSSGKLKRDWSPGTQRDYRSVLDYHLIANFGALRIESISSARIERWRDERVRDHDMSRRLANKLLAILHGIFEYAVRKHGLLRNPVKDVEKLRESYDAARFDFYSPEEVRELVAKAGDSQDGVLYLTAAFSGLRRGELIGLLWEDVDFENHSIRVWETVTLRERGLPKSRKSRTVPMVDDVAGALKGLKAQERYTQPKDSVFAGEDGGLIDGSALRRRYIADLERAGLRFLRFHDLRHTFGSLAINSVSIVQVQAWMGHADIKTTMRYLHHKSRADDARLLSSAFRPESEELDEAA